jgi:tetratricopeptide (TPR) repeat protein
VKALSVILQSLFFGNLRNTGPGGFQKMASFPYERRSGRDRRAGGDRRQLDRRLREGEDKDQYEEDRERAAEMTAHLGEVWHGKGKDLFNRHKYEDARKAFKKALEIRSDIAEAWFLLGCIDSLKGEKSEALSMLAKAVELEQDYREKAKVHSAFKKYREDSDFERIVR